MHQIFGHVKTEVSSSPVWDEVVGYVCLSVFHDFLTRPMSFVIFVLGEMNIADFFVDILFYFVSVLFTFFCSPFAPLFCFPLLPIRQRKDSVRAVFKNNGELVCVSDIRDC